MVRILISYVIPLFLPTALYFIWVSWVRRQIEAKHAQVAKVASTKASDAGGPVDETITPEEVAAYDIPTPWFRLAIAGAVLVFISLILSVFFTPQNPPGSVYHPPHMENGQVVPGQFIPKPH
jgi:hypothetical protein